MSNSIWKKPDQKPDSRKQILIYDGVDYSIEISHPEYWEDKGLVEKWCYLNDLIAQADKAERLQKAVDLIANMEQRLCIDDPVDILDDVLKIAKDEIKQLIKETTNDK